MCLEALDGILFIMIAVGCHQANQLSRLILLKLVKQVSTWNVTVYNQITFLVLWFLFKHHLFNLPQTNYKTGLIFIFDYYLELYGSVDRQPLFNYNT